MSNRNGNLPKELLPYNKCKVFKCAEHAVNISKQLQTFYEKKELLDIVLIAGVDNTKLQAHRLILYASSGYFLAMSRSIEATADEIEIKDFDGVTLQLMLDFMYTSSIVLRNEIVGSVLRAADFLQMQTLMTACCDFISDQLDVSNCLGIVVFADQNNYLPLETKSLAFASKHLQQVCNHKDFFLLNKDQLKKCITAGDRYLESEEEHLFLSIGKWIAYDKNREQYAFDILSLLRFKLLQPLFIIDNRHCVCKTIDCYDLTSSWLRWHMCGNQQKTNKTLVVTTGIKNDYLTLWTIKSKRWVETNISRPSQNRPDCFCIIAMDKILVAAGSVFDTPYIACLNIADEVWFDLPEMKEKLHVILMAELNGELYVFGRNMSNRLQTGEKYNFFTRQWKIIEFPIEADLINYQVAALDGFLYLICEGHPMLYCYDPVANEWINKARKEVVSEHFGIAAVCGHLYTVGGISNGKNCEAVERYNPLNDTWTVIDLKVHGGPTQCTSLNNMLIIYCEELTYSNVMEYNSLTTTALIVCAMPQSSTKNYILTA